MKDLIRYFVPLAFWLGPFALAAQRFVIPVMPDTQVEVNNYSDMFFSRMQWVVEHKDSIPFVLHVGDLVNYDNYVHWDNASEGYDLLDANHIKYAIAIGNHDGAAVQQHSGSAAAGDVNKNLRITDKFNHYFPRSRFIAQRGSQNERTSDNSYYTFKAGTANWLVMSIEFCPRPEIMEWANQVARDHSQYNIIVQTHYYLTPEGEIATDNAGYGDLAPMDLFERFVKKHKNILMVVSGHVGGSSFRKDIGINGNTIYSLLQNYQGDDMGGGYMRLLYFDLEKKTIKSKTYSAYYDRFKDVNEVDFENVDFIVRPKE